MSPKVDSNELERIKDIAEAMEAQVEHKYQPIGSKRNLEDIESELVRLKKRLKPSESETEVTCLTTSDDRQSQSSWKVPSNWSPRPIGAL